MRRWGSGRCILCLLWALGGTVATPASARPALTVDKVKAFVLYQREQTERAGRALVTMKGLLDGGLANLETSSELYQAMRKRAEDEEASRRRSGLSQKEIGFLEHLTLEVLSKRTFARTYDFDARLRELEVIKGQLPKEQQAVQAKRLEALKAQQQALTHLTEERAKYGDANVDLVLAQEAELTRNFHRVLDVLGR